MQIKLAELQTGLAIAETAASQIPLEAGGEDFDRMLDTTVVKIHSKVAFSQQTVCDDIAEVNKETQLSKAAYKMVGKEIAKYQVLQFTGSGGLAEQRAKKFMQVPDGWRKSHGVDEND